MADKNTFESNTFACKTFACGSFSKNQQQITFVRAKTFAEPTIVAASEAHTYPTDFSVVYTGIWQQAEATSWSYILSGRTLSSGSNALLTKRTLEEPTSTEHNDLILLGTTTGTSVVQGMAVPGATTNVRQPKAFNSRLMKEPT